MGESSEATDGDDRLVGPAATVGDVAEFDKKHPLQNKWTLWYDNPQRKATQQSWSRFLKKVTEFESVEDFWTVYNNIVPASKLSPGSNYHLFKAGVQPMWEDPMNAEGGKWVATLRTSAREDKMDFHWLATMLAMVGEALDDDGQVMGAVVSVRRAQDKIAVWTRYASGDHEGVIKRIGERFKAAGNFECLLSFQAHEDYSSFKNNVRYEIPGENAEVEKGSVDNLDKDKSDRFFDRSMSFASGERPRDRDRDREERGGWSGGYSSHDRIRGDDRDRNERPPWAGGGGSGRDGGPSRYGRDGGGERDKDNYGDDRDGRYAARRERSYPLDYGRDRDRDDGRDREYARGEGRGGERERGPDREPRDRDWERGDGGRDRMPPRGGGDRDRDGDRGGRDGEFYGGRYYDGGRGRDRDYGPGGGRNWAASSSDSLGPASRQGSGAAAGLAKESRDSLAGPSGSRASLDTTGSGARGPPLLGTGSSSSTSSAPPPGMSALARHGSLTQSSGSLSGMTALPRHTSKTNPAPTNPVGVLFTQQPSRPGHMGRSGDKGGVGSGSQSSFSRQMSQPSSTSHNAVRLSSLPVQAPQPPAAAAGTSASATGGSSAGPRGWGSTAAAGAAAAEKKEAGPAVQSMSGALGSSSAGALGSGPRPWGAPRQAGTPPVTAAAIVAGGATVSQPKEAPPPPTQSLRSVSLTREVINSLRPSYSSAGSASSDNKP